MKKILVVSMVAASFAASAFGADGAAIYKKCVACHGANAEKVYMNKVAALNTISKDERLKAMQEYKAGTLNKYKMGAVMKGQMAKLSDEDIKALNDYIDTLKK